MSLSNRSAPLARAFQLTQLATHLGGLDPELRVVMPSGGRGGVDGDRLIDRVAIDSREAGPGSVFVALRGERVDGHGFIEALSASGLPCALVERAWYEANPRLVGTIGDNGTCLFVTGSPLALLQAWAGEWRRSFRSLTCVGVTGSSGKTTVKDMLRAVLAPLGPLWASAGNLNSVIGSPLAVLAMPPETRLAVFEMAMSEKGEMSILADMIRPDIAIITNIGLAHIANLGSQEAIAAEKKAIASCFAGRETLVLPVSDAWAPYLARDVAGTIVWYGESCAGPDYTWEADGHGGQVLRVGGQAVHLPLPGAHIRADALGVLAIARICGVDAATAARGFAAFSPGFGRGQILQGRVRIILDCYNANPDSMAASIEASAEYGALGRRVLVLGDMLELGEVSATSHRDIGLLAAGSGAELCVFVGAAMAHAHEAALEAIPSSGGGGETQRPRLVWYPDFEHLAPEAGKLFLDGDSILLKASRGMALERLVPLIDPQLTPREAPHV